ncbi:nucleoside diphosphate-linked moiety X motif 8-like [Ostrinia furnacalis]|uniref:nucleoside diphosphate-linked moiety X motif 8-like n=1 Tax=Ostrinia furnacalis TaxID=93504 RepID=UPI00103D676C|nr:nucleoside diphosphate-linked moiety X motif 8-like [Ostrinia furnacalis]
MCAFTVQNIFSLACRDRCMAKLRTLIPLPSHGKPPNSTAAVLVPLCRVEGVPSLLYTVRSATFRPDVIYSGQITFPGGKCEKDETAVQTALRETKEELGLPSEKINVWGQGPAIPSQTNEFMITPVIGALQELKPTDLMININEVAEAFTVPIAHLCDPKNQFYTQFSNGYILPVFIAEDYKIWGITAYITHAFLTCALSKNVYHNEWLKKKIDIKSE